jgi:predicted metalloprotease
MTFRGNAPLDPSQVEDQRGRGGFGGGGGGGGGLGGPVVVGGGGLGIIILIIALLLGVNPLSDVGGTSPSIDGAPSVQDCQTGADANKRDDCRIVGFVDSIQKYWTDEFARRGDTYLPAKTVLFTDAVQGACGLAETAMGPFYCPEDQKVYLDIAFFAELTQRFGAQGGPFAQGYVVAHEYGHHVQDLLGTLSSSQNSNAASIRIELQADCLAGVWARHAADTGYLEAPTDAEIAQAVDAAKSVGDDRIQQETQGRVQPEQWTHGSSAQRTQWFTTGYQTGDMDRCDTSRV